ncbi:hypothetical protein SGFS_079910 [Streptomyces graminofaciens]|uniref:TIR domain-containing protein n=1 Tax=Streptomyces graminofaciens TaxID=68212 RepID=A0ABN5VTY7_9ACTN|nr:TIR-like protein FxsC [Streptomyces graminofaciens]BBC36697.1 hypothetical protein SGFS_079910 [Streptomyces graminofaciens]
MTPERGWAAADQRPYFYLSYARSPASEPGAGDPDHWVHTLFKDLCEHVQALTDCDGATAGFMDRASPTGEGQKQRIATNLAHCRVFVPLYSPRYFASETCGREWFAFNARVLRASAAGAGHIRPVVPVLWSRVDLDRLPDPLRHVPVEPTTGERYRTQGIYGLIKLRRLRDEYEETVFALAQRIVRTARETPLPPGEPRPLAATPSAFRTPGDGPRRVHLSVAAPTRRTVDGHRGTQPYGESALTWNPYHNETTRPLPELAEELIRSLDYRITVSDFDDDLAMGEADTRTDKPSSGHPALLLVDCWAVLDEERRRRLKAFDANSRPWVAAVIPWNRADVLCEGEEGRRIKAELERTLPLILERGRRTDSRIAVNGVPTLKAFTDVLPAVMAHLTQQYLKHADAHPPEGLRHERPRLRGPIHPHHPDHRGEA